MKNASTLLLLSLLLFSCKTKDDGLDDDFDFDTKHKSSGKKAVESIFSTKKEYVLNYEKLSGLIGDKESSRNTNQQSQKSGKVDFASLLSSVKTDIKDDKQEKVAKNLPKNQDLPKTLDELQEELKNNSSQYEVPEEAAPIKENAAVIAETEEPIKEGFQGYKKPRIEIDEEIIHNKKGEMVKRITANKIYYYKNGKITREVERKKPNKNLSSEYADYDIELAKFKRKSLEQLNTLLPSANTRDLVFIIDALSYKGKGGISSLAGLLANDKSLNFPKDKHTKRKRYIWVEGNNKFEDLEVRTWAAYMLQLTTKQMPSNVSFGERAGYMFAQVKGKGRRKAEVAKAWLEWWNSNQVKH